MAVREWKPGCPVWEEDVENPRAREQRRHVFNKVVTEDCKKLPSAQMAKVWHQELFDNLVPHLDYLGNFRDVENTPWCLQGYDVHVGDVQGVFHEYVLEALDVFFEKFESKVKELDHNWQEHEGKYSVGDIDQVVELAAWAHGEWVRIHPFANGNGRTARLWANYVFCRYGLLPIVVVRPRPDEPYGLAARVSMKYAEHEPTKQLFWQLLIKSYQEASVIKPPF